MSTSFTQPPVAILTRQPIIHLLLAENLLLAEHSPTIGQARRFLRFCVLYGPLDGAASVIAPSRIGNCHG